MNPAIIAALRAHAAGLHPEEAGTELLIGHGGILHRDDFAASCTPAPASATALP